MTSESDIDFDEALPDSPADPAPPRSRPTWVLRGAKALAICLAISVLIAGAGFFYAWKWHNGPALANRLAKGYNAKRRGRMTIGSVRWTPRAALDILWGRDSTVIIRNLTLYDSKGRRVAHFPCIVAQGQLLPLLMDGSFKVTRAEADEARFRVDYYPRPEGPDRRSGDTHEVGILGALEHTDPFHPRPKTPSVYNFKQMHIKRMSISYYHRLFQVHLRRIALTGSLFVTASTPFTPTRIRFSLKPSGGQGELRVAGKRLPLADIEAPCVRSDPDHPRDLELAVGGRVGGARFRLSSRMQRLLQSENPSVQLDAHFTDFAALLSKVTGLDLSGAAELLTLQTRGPLQATTTHARLTGLTARVRAGERSVRIEDIFARLELSGGKVTLKALHGHALDGSLFAQGELDLSDRRFGARLGLSGVTITPLLSTRARRRLLGGAVSGRLAMRGTLKPWALDVDSLDLTLAREARYSSLPRRLRLRGRGRLTPATLTVGRLALTGYGLNLTARGEVGLTTRRLKLAVTAELVRLRSMLRGAGLPALARSGALHGQLRGTLGRPRLYAEVSLKHAGYRNVRAPLLRSQISFARGTLTFDKLRGGLGGGLLNGSGRVQLLRPGRWRLRAHPYVKARLSVANASLRALLPGRQISGRVGAQVTFQGRAGRFTGKGLIRLKNGLFAGQPVHGGMARVRLKDNRLELEQLHMSWAGGGSLRATGSLHVRTGGLALRGRIANLPLAALSENPGFRRVVSGALSGGFDISGDRTRPVIAALLQLTRVRVRSILMGSGRVKLSPAGGAGTHIQGELFKRFRISGRWVLQPEPAVRLTVRFVGLPLHELAPELTRLPAELTAVASGHAELDFDLTRGLRRLAVTLTKLRLQLKQRDHLPGDAPQRVSLSNEGDVRLLHDGQRLHVLHLRLQGRTGWIEARGWLTPQDSALRLDGRVELGDLAFLLQRWVDSVKGRVYVKATLRGSPRKPRVDCALILAGIRILLPGRQVPLRIATARLRLTNNALMVKQARVAIDTDELWVTGAVKLAELRPTRLDLRLHGKLSAQLLHLIGPRTFGQVRGRALADLRLVGPPKTPDIAGRIRLEPITFTLRGASREFGIKSGMITIARKRIRIREVRGSVDEGTFVVDGLVKLSPRWPYDMDVSIRGLGIPVKKARSYELELNTNLRLQVAHGRASLSGLVDVADGRFMETFDVVSRAFLKRRVYEQRAPFWETNELLRNARLNITVASHGPLIIKNNLADIRLEGNIHLRGTPLQPRFGGQIRAESGTFRIPFLRGQFTVRSGELDFDHPFGFGETYVKIVGETSYTDTSETEHEITVSLEGPLSRIAIQLDSSTGLNQSQILMLLASGRTMDQLRRQMRRGDAGPGQTSRSANPLDAYDSSLKQVTGDFLSQLVAQPLQAWTRLDLVRLEMGTESFQVRINKRLGRYVRLAGEAELGLMGRQRQEGRVEMRVLDQLSVDAKARRQIPGDDTVIDEDRYQGRIELRYRIRLRTSLRRTLGF